jgi:hypothetical protein
MNYSLVTRGLLLGACTLVVLRAWRRVHEIPIEQDAKRRHVFGVAIMFTLVEVGLLLLFIAELKSVP